MCFNYTKITNTTNDNTKCAHSHVTGSGKIQFLIKFQNKENIVIFVKENDEFK